MDKYFIGRCYLYPLGRPCTKCAIYGDKCKCYLRVVDNVDPNDLSGHIKEYIYNIRTHLLLLEEFIDE